MVVLANGDIVAEVVDATGAHFLYLWDGTATGGGGLEPAYWKTTGDVQYLTATLDGGIAYWDSTAGELIWKDSTLERVAWATPDNVEQIVVLGPLPGDVNGDGLIDGTDLTIILGNWGKTGQGLLGGDLNGDGIVEGNDYSEVLSYWGPAEPPEPTPEPATMVLLAVGGLLGLVRKRR